MTPTDKDLAEFARLGLEFKLLGLPQIVAWGDEVIETRDDPPTWALDLSMADKEEAALAVFKEMHWLRGDLTPLIPQRLVLELMKRDWMNGKLQWQQIWGPLWDLIKDEDRELPFDNAEKIRDLYGWIDFRLFENDGTVTDDEIVAFLRRIFTTSEPQVIRLPNWV